MYKPMPRQRVEMLEWERWGGGGVEIEKGGMPCAVGHLYQRTTALQAMNVGILTVAKAMEVV